MKPTSHILKRIVHTLQNEKNNTVLDFCNLRSANFNFFKVLSSQQQVLDFKAEIIQQQDFERVLGYFRKMLSGKVFRIILLWDLLNDLNDLQVKRLFRLIEYISDADSYIHCIMHVGKKIPKKSLDCYIDQMGELIYKFNPNQVNPNYTQLDDRPLNVCDNHIIHDDRLLPQGGREILLTLKKTA